MKMRFIFEGCRYNSFTFGDRNSITFTDGKGYEAELEFKENTDILFALVAIEKMIKGKPEPTAETQSPAKPAAPSPKNTKPQWRQASGPGLSTIRKSFYADSPAELEEQLVVALNKTNEKREANNNPKRKPLTDLRFVTKGDTDLVVREGPKQRILVHFKRV
jgi:hypothetical protein